MGISHLDTLAPSIMSSKLFLAVGLLSAVVAMVAADSPYGPRPIIPILKDDRTQDGYGGYTFDFETGNGIARQEVGNQNNGQVSQGGWRYESPEGLPVEISFVADHGGYQPQGAVIPVAPPL